MVPNGWTLEPFGKLLISSNQGVNTTTECIEYSNSGYAAIRSNNVIEGGFDFSDEKFVDEQTFLRVSSRFKPNIGDVLYCNIGSNLGSACVNTFDQEFLITWNVFRAVPKNDFLSSEYCAYILNFKRLDLRRYATESTMPFISSKVLLQYKLLVPPLDEQVKIVEILSTWDQAISATEKLLENSQQQKKALMQQLLTGKKRLLDENGVEFSDEWQRIELGLLLDYQQPTPYLVESTAYSNSYETPVLTAGKTFILGYTNESSGIYQDQLPVIIFDDFTTDSKYVNFPFKAKSSAMKILTAKKGVSIKFVFDAMQMLQFTVGGHQRHWISIFSNLVIPLPNIKEQQQIAEVLSLADQEIETLQKELDCLKQEKKALMQQLLTGKKRVKVAA
ncbi:restriction endonuclease subunit S [Acinetobacter sp. YH12144]|uniref:restriction endonuclease subunit S n=1 Tax=Acinetobacter sp. YH12144 TaxID=2601128 RepID=UPI0015D305DA|nr:restriction endonuclease subunit S [Acinetobacter sp. YH12144]